MRDIFESARTVAAGGLVVASGLAVTGAVLDWVRITPPKILPADEVVNAQPFSGIEAGDGWWVLGCGITLLFSAGLLIAARRSRYAWLALVASIIIGGIALADLRGVEDLVSPISQRMNIVGDARPAIGLYLTAAGAVLGSLAAILGIAATPSGATART
ncbi:MAG TPA: hypothetical protein VNC78_01315 [Actinomycetota bacterium]|nr:hypothetical protein [Actinomycetota bacterium]